MLTLSYHMYSIIKIQSINEYHVISQIKNIFLENSKSKWKLKTFYIY